MNDETLELDPSQAASLLERFVIDNDALGDLEREIGRFNIFDSLRIVDKEIRHSNFLAWLLDPAESHGLGQLFLRAVLMDLLRSAPRDDRPMSPVDLDGADLIGVRVEREWRNIDLLIVAEDPKIVIAIENKIWSGEHSKQLKRYRDTVLKELSSHRPLFVFLTREGEEPSDENWSPYSYAQLHAALDRCRRLNSDTIGDEVGVFLDHYLRIVRSRFMDDERIMELCTRIYNNHRQAIDLINEKRADPRARVVQRVAELLEADSLEWDTRALTRSCIFWPKVWNGIIPPIGAHGKRAPNGLLRFTLNATPKHIYMELFIAPSTDPDQRKQLVDAISERGHDHGFRLRSQTPGKEWTTVYSTRIAKSPEGLTDDDKTIAEIAGLVEDLSARAEKMTVLLREVFSTA